jgi:outer membrane protein OmpA-like peptidoglycan-associated protein
MAGFLALALTTSLAARAEEPVPAAPAPAAAAAEGDASDCIGKARLRGLEFSNGGSELEGNDTAILDLVADAIKNNCTGKTVTIEGHTSLSGSAEHNQTLSLNRAEAVRAYLISRGVPAEQVKAVGYGSSRPLTSDPSPDAQKVNRRVTLVAS